MLNLGKLIPTRNMQRTPTVSICTRITLTSFPSCTRSCDDSCVCPVTVLRLILPGTAALGTFRLGRRARFLHGADPLGGDRQLVNPQSLGVGQQTAAEVGHQEELIELHVGEVRKE